MKQNEKLRNKPTHIWTTDFWQGCKDASVQKA